MKNDVLNQQAPEMSPALVKELDRILELLADTFPLTIEKTDGKIVLDGTGCGGEE